MAWARCPERFAAAVFGNSSGRVLNPPPSQGRLLNAREAFLNRARQSPCMRLDIAERGPEIAVAQRAGNQDYVPAAAMQSGRESGAERVDPQFRPQAGGSLP